MKMMNYLAFTLLLVTLLLASGCIVATPKSKRAPLETKPVDAVLVVGVDLSGSFAADFSERAYPLLLNVMQSFFVEQMGDDCKVVLSQISSHDDVVLFEGTPRDLRRRFPSPDALAAFLLANSKPNSSPVFKAMNQTLHYVNQMADIGEQTEVLTVVISDLRDSEKDRAVWKKKGFRMLEELKRYQQRGGAIALYYVDLEQVDLWKRILEAAKFEPGMFVISNDLVEDPQLPSFD